jgi:hypothetical protein
LSTIGVACAAAAAAALVFATAAAAHDRDDVRVRGKCTQASTWKLELSEEDGGVEVEFEVDQNRAGVRWGVVIRRGDRVIQRTTKVTRVPSGSFEARVVSRREGRFTATATRPGERCTAAATF